MSDRLVFISNFLSPHQMPICQQFLKLLNGEFLFVATKPINEERLSLGYTDLNQESFVLRAYESDEQTQKALRIAEEAEVVIIGSAPDTYIVKRLKARRLTFKYSERLLKKKLTLRRYPRFVLGTWLHHGRFMKYPLYMLCAGGYVSEDFDRLGYYKNRCYQWGYFPEKKEYADIHALINAKEENTILWAGRLIDWKHPEYPVRIAKRLKEEGYVFRLKIIGNGAMEAQLKEMLQAYDLKDCVSMLGSMEPSQVREHMEKSQIFLFTSNRQEGWGAVLNESMNSACAVVANSEIGAVPFLLQNEENGLVYKDGDFEELYTSVKRLLDDKKICRKLEEKAYETIVNVWNAEVAAERFISLTASLKEGTDSGHLQGPCSIID